MSGADDIGRALRGRRNGSGWLVRCPCAGHGNGHGDRNPSLSIADGADGRLLLRCFAGCTFDNVLAALHAAGLVDDAPRHPSAPARRAVDPAHHPDPAALRIWCEAMPAAGTVVEEYLAHRGIPAAPPSIRKGTVLHLGRYDMPAMVAGIQRPDGEVVAVQTTILTPAGRKASVAVPKVSHGALGAGAVRLGPTSEIQGVAEGIETGLSAQLLSGLPVWVSLGSQRLAKVDLPETVREVHIFGDNDLPGREAARRAAEVHVKLGRRVVLRFPPDPFGDFNDLLLALADLDGDDQRLVTPSRIEGAA